jgi:hypothetical protein
MTHRRRRLDIRGRILGHAPLVAALQTTEAKSRESFLRHISKQDCASCHQQYLPMAAVGHGGAVIGRSSRSKEAGFDRHLVKPVDPDALHTLLVDANVLAAS